MSAREHVHVGTRGTLLMYIACVSMSVCVIVCVRKLNLACVGFPARTTCRIYLFSGQVHKTAPRFHRRQMERAHLDQAKKADGR